MKLNSSEYVEKTIKRLNFIARESIQKGKTNTALAALWANGWLQYHYNQEYVDISAENLLHELSSVEKHKVVSGTNRVIFYDGFGDDLRGLAYIYLNGLIKCGYKVVYVVSSKVKDKQPNIVKLLAQEKNEIMYIPEKYNYQEQLLFIREIFNGNYAAYFLYINPNDIPVIVAASEIEGGGNRYLINLTDHAFWLGNNAFDYCIEFREYGESISHHYRNVPAEKLVRIPYYPIINYEIKFKGFPFECEDKKVVFSGGALYKTFDAYGTYYRIIDKMLEENRDTVFMYAGVGDKTELEKLKYKYRERVFLVDERQDLFQILKRSTIYLNTYPISGALMLQYAAKAGCVPVTLRREWDEDALGILKNEEELGEIFTSFEDVSREINRLLRDKNYLIAKQKLLENSVISETEFVERLRNVLESKSDTRPREIGRVDTKRYRKTFKDNMKERNVLSAIGRRKNICLFKYFPMVFIRMFLTKLKENVKERFK